MELKAKISEIIDKGEVAEETTEEVEETTEGTEEGTEEVQSDDEPIVEDELDEASTKEAKSLYKLLKDPNTRTHVLTVLAQTAGILNPKDPPETKAEIKEARRDIKQIIKDKLGDDYKFISDKLGEAIEEVLEQERSDLNQSTEEIRLTQIQSTVDGALARLSKETNGASKKLEGAIASLVSKYPQPEGTSVYDYLKDMYNLAGGKATSPNGKIAQRIQRNANDAASRLRTIPGSKSGTEPGKGQVIPEKKGIRGAVQAALKAMENN